MSSLWKRTTLNGVSIIQTLVRLDFEYYFFMCNVYISSPLIVTIFSHFAGTASIARGLSNYIDSLVDRKIRTTFAEWMPMQINFLAPYPDFLSFSFVVMLTGICLAAYFVEPNNSSFNLSIFFRLNLVTLGIVIDLVPSRILNYLEHLT